MLMNPRSYPGAQVSDGRGHGRALIGPPPLGPHSNADVRHASVKSIGVTPMRTWTANVAVTDLSLMPLEIHGGSNSVAADVERWFFLGVYSWPAR